MWRLHTAQHNTVSLTTSTPLRFNTPVNHSHSTALQPRALLRSARALDVRAVDEPCLLCAIGVVMVAIDPLDIALSLVLASSSSRQPCFAHSHHL